jgi:hypothetical protein
MKKKQIQIGSSWKDKPTVFLKLRGVKPNAKNDLMLNLTPEDAAAIGREIQQLGEFCMKEFKQDCA